MAKERYVVTVNLEVDLIVEAGNHTEAACNMPNNADPIKVRKASEFDPDLSEVVVDNCVFCSLPLLSNAEGTSYKGVGVPKEVVPKEYQTPFDPDMLASCESCADKRGIGKDKG